MDWGHLHNPVDSPDSVWPLVSSHVRDAYVTYLFSDHVVNPDLKAEEERELAEEEVEEAEGEGEGQEYADDE